MNRLRLTANMEARFSIFSAENRRSEFPPPPFPCSTSKVVADDFPRLVVETFGKSVIVYQINGMPKQCIRFNRRFLGRDTFKATPCLGWKPSPTVWLW
ncbi:hypothetical protein WG31_10525 [Acetobacter oryzifermentans]|uniref:Uncharacterized protein n=1 Tax=Acetobacter oryzifermentans TaxID=1633874 RepID=A0ABM6AKZ3_9PROT|nr:hypothetical protein WG31_10525 [Acetobacter oryzifermentans]